MKYNNKYSLTDRKSKQNIKSLNLNKQFTLNIGIQSLIIHNQKTLNHLKHKQINYKLEIKL